MTAASCYLFRGLPSEKMNTIGEISHLQNIKAGEWLFHKSDKAAHIYLVEEGAIELLMPVEPAIEDRLRAALGRGELRRPIRAAAQDPFRRVAPGIIGQDLGPVRESHNLALRPIDWGSNRRHFRDQPRPALASRACM